ncbi:hypothetical protein BST61_g11170 [Cercospora zeina]
MLRREIYSNCRGERRGQAILKLLRDFGENAAKLAISGWLGISVRLHLKTQDASHLKRRRVALIAQLADLHTPCISRLLLASASRKLVEERLAIPPPSSARHALSSTTSTNVNEPRLQHIKRFANLCALPHPDTSLFRERALRRLQCCPTADEPASQSFRQAQNFDPHSREVPLLWLVDPHVNEQGRLLASQTSPVDISLQHRDSSVRPLRLMYACLQQCQSQSASHL